MVISEKAKRESRKLSEALEAYRVEHNLRISDLARKLEEPRTTVVGWLNVAKKGSPQTITKKGRAKARAFLRQGEGGPVPPSKVPKPEAPKTPRKERWPCQSEIMRMAVDVSALRFYLRRLILEGDRRSRENLREVLGDDFWRFINCTRALTSEKARSQMLAELGNHSSKEL